VFVDGKDGFKRFLRKEPLGVVFVCGAWNYPYLIAVNAVVPALLAGNTVILKQSSATLLCAERFAEAFEAAGLPKHVFQYLHMTHSGTAALIQHPKVAFVNFTGSVEGGRDIQKASSEKFMGVGLELGGKDPAYVRQDCDMDYTVEQLVDGTYFNSGQCCCAIERIYVHEAVYDRFVQKFAGLVESLYRLGDPTDKNTNLGPMVRTSAADWVRKQVKEAIAAGAKSLVSEDKFPKSEEGTPYMAPVVLVDVDHSMSVMKEESFGPVIGIMKVSSDEEAISLMNDSDFGLTAGIWTQDIDAATRIGSEVQTGTLFVNKCDYLDPALAWTGVKDSGRGVSLSKFGFDQLTQIKSFNMKIN
ncbi:aldehyde dehydrogenase, partial [Sphaeroforma arctica JP610]